MPSSTTQSVTFCELLVFQSQSEIGRQCSKACTVISLLLAKAYLTNKSFMSCMRGGNPTYDSFMQSQSHLGVVEAIPLVRSSLDSLSYEDCFFVKEPNSSKKSALIFHLCRRPTNTNAAFIIINDLTFTFVSETTTSF